MTQTLLPLYRTKYVEYEGVHSAFGMRFYSDKMASEEDFDLEKDLPRFLAEVLDKFEYLFQGNFDVEGAEAHAEVLDQTISLVRSLKDCCSLDTRDKENLDSIAEAFGDVLCILRRSIIIPSTVATDSVTIESGKSGSRGRPCLKIPVEMRNCKD